MRMDLLNNLMQIGLTVSLAALVPLMLRRVMKERCGAIFAQPQYSTDNAMGVAILTWRQLKERGA